ncbi:hypothetical protein [Rubrivirga sp.]|uniref:hypothetical protein n=1 Tax=Rubrivirga sp. TaxID=1885344 RepID=UPI003C78A78D
MRRLASLFLLATLTLGSAPTADAQLRGLIDRARDAVTGTSNDAQAEAEAAPRRDGPTPDVDYVGLLDTVLYGDWDDNDTYVLFAPDSDAEPIGAYVLRDEQGGELGRFPLKIDHQRSGTVASAVSWSHRSGGLNGIPNANGTLTLDLEFEGAVIGSVPYVQTSEQVGSAFDSRRVTRMQGPWQTHGYFFDNGDASSELHFAFWTTSGESAPAEVIVARDGTEVAFGERRERVTGSPRSVFRLFGSQHRGGFLGDDQEFSRSELTPGGLEVVVLDEDGAEMRRFALEAGDGTFVPHVRSEPGHEPHALTLAPRHAPSGEQELVHVFWTTTD